MSKGELIIRPLPKPDLDDREPEPWTRGEKIRTLLIVALPIAWGVVFLAAMCLWAVLR
jgi:hypothetical protein